MLTPLDKLQSGVNDIIQIVVTTSCDLFSCSNCTQLLPFRKDYRHMSLECFIRAVESVKDWPGVVALFGGNPCSHPKFEDLCEVLRVMIPEQRRRGIWTNNFLGKGPAVQKTFYPNGRFNLNAHGNAAAAMDMDYWCRGKVIPASIREEAWHSPILLDYRNFGMPYDVWEAMREQCNINQKWSAAIVERDGEPYAYFCEVAAALDGISGRNNGIRALPGWWKNGMSVFESQVSACCDQGCGVPLNCEGHRDSDSTYDVTLNFYGLTKTNKFVRSKLHSTPPLANNRETTDYMHIREGRHE